MKHGILPLMSRLARIISTVLITAGLVVIADVGLTLAYKEPLSSIYGELKQAQAADQLADLESQYPTRADLAAIADVENPEAKARILARRFAEQAREGEAIGRLVVPSMDANVIVLEGTDTGTLQEGPGHYPQTRFPGQRGTTAIAGHRTTYLAPFRDIDSTRKGDSMTLQMPYATFTYRIEKVEIVEPSRVDIVRNVGRERLVLTACHPLYSAAQRYAIFGSLTEVAVFDASRGGPWQAN